jgi:hypothetical protein
MNKPKKNQRRRIMNNLSEQKIIQIGLKALVDAWPSKKKNWPTLPNWALFAIGKAVIKSNSPEYWGKLIYLSREVDQMIDNILEYDPELYYTRSGRGYVYDDGAHAQYGELSSIMTVS